MPNSETKLSPPEYGAATGSPNLVQRAVAGGMTGGRRGGRTIHARPAIMSAAGVLWTSPVPENDEQARFFNRSANLAANASRQDRSVAPYSARGCSRLESES